MTVIWTRVTPGASRNFRVQATAGIAGLNWTEVFLRPTRRRSFMLQAVTEIALSEWLVIDAVPEIVGPAWA
jgi:hypothetical protein